jgi:hypothetical protein
VLATIELHQSFYQRDKHRKDGMTQQQKHYSNYNQCLSFIIAASNTWSCLDLVVSVTSLTRDVLSKARTSNLILTIPLG